MDSPSQMEHPPSTIETLYSHGPIGSLPDIGPQRPNKEFEAYKAEVLGLQKDRVKKGKTRPLTTSEPRNKDSRTPSVQGTGLEPRNKDPELGEHLKDPVYWYGSLISFLIIVAIVVVIVLIFASSFYRDIDSKQVYRPYGDRYQPPQSDIFFVLTMISSLLLVAVSHINHLKLGEDDGMRYISMLILAITLIILIVWSFLFFGTSNSKDAFLTSIILGLTIIGWAWISWTIDRISSILLLLYLPYVVYLGWISWDRLQDDLYYSDHHV
jgi:tryptophan-rich sensory protein